MPVLRLPQPDIVAEVFAEFRTWPLIRERINNVLRGFAEACWAKYAEDEKLRARKARAWPW